MMSYTLAVVLLWGGRPAAQPPGHTLPVHTIPVKGQPSHLLVHQNKLFVSCFEGSNLGIFDTATRKELQQLVLDAYESPADPKTGAPHSVHRCPPGDMVVANGKLFVAQTFGEHVVVFDLKTMWVVKRLSLAGAAYFPTPPDSQTHY